MAVEHVSAVGLVSARAKVRGYVALVRPGPSRHRAAVYYVEGTSAANARACAREEVRAEGRTPTFVRVREVCQPAVRLKPGRYEWATRLWSVE